MYFVFREWTIYILYNISLVIKNRSRQIVVEEPEQLSITFTQSERMHNPKGFPSVCRHVMLLSNIPVGMNACSASSRWK